MTGKTILPRHFSAVEVKQQYARVAWFYDAWGRLTEDKALKRLLALAAVEDGLQILEVATGTGRMFEKLVSLNSSGFNEGMDLSPAMLDHARKRLERTASTGNFRLQEGSAYQLPYPSEKFDLLFNTFMLDLLPVEDYPEILGEFMRVLKPGGRLALAYFSGGAKWYNQPWSWIAEHFPTLLTGCRPVEPEDALRRAGFEILHQESVSQNTFPASILMARKST